ncbi:restriction endonuclease subunit S [Aureispira sp. CCB-QB1]|uniref:restriction endonuclease subunit S n=1 Tax=Aureispira sp. CCB-QB1 TaxID=1313421 RepID=UPI0006963A07|nr:restriction endonuclease subunit S [Aureispira sp. CCB-QB1]
MKRYEKYKDSGIEWIGEIPKHWEVKKLNWCFKTIGSGTTPKSGDKEYYFNGVYNWLLTGDLNDGEVHETTKKITDKALEDYSSLKEFSVNSIVIAMYGATIGKLGILKIPTTVNQACCVFSEPIHLNYKFLFYILFSARQEIINLSYGGGQPNISQEVLKQFRVQVPPLQEQIAIANYLDRKTADLDQLIAEKEQLIKLYEEEKTAIINQAVTKGINPDVALKDSGIEWLGDIPVHWEVKKLNWCFKNIGSGTTPKSGNKEYYFNGVHNWLLTGDLNEGEIYKTTKKITDKALEDYSSLKEYPINSIVIAMYGATIGKLGILKIPTTVNQACCVFSEPILLTYKFAFYILLSAREEIINMSYGGGQPNISQLLLRQFKIQVPPKNEQTTIVAYIEQESQRINTKIKKAKQYINLLTEYRTALISEVVIGKIKVID